MHSLFHYNRFRTVKVVSVIILFLSLFATEGFSQGTYYYTFNITGPTSICVGSTYSYGAPGDATWSVSGGTIVSGQGSTSIQVLWESLAGGSISASFTEYSGGDCWWNYETFPPEFICNPTTTYHYTSNDFYVYSGLTGYSLTGSNICSGSPGTTITYSGSQTNVTYQLKRNGSNVGGTVVGTGSALTWTNQPAGDYILQGTRSGCSVPVVLGNVYIQVISSTGGTLSGGVAACASVSRTFTLSDYVGMITRWEQNTGSGWVNIAHTAPTYSVTNVTTSTTYRVWVVNGSCPGAYSSEASITISPASVGGSVSGPSLACAPASGTLTLSGHTGSVVRWEYGSSSSNWVNVSNTSNALNFTNLPANPAHYYRAIVKSGVCAEVASSLATVVVDEPASGGSLYPASSDYYGSNATGQFVLGNYTGEIRRWEQNTGSGWTTISSTDYQYTYSVSQSTTYRAALQVGAGCPEVYSSHATIHLYPAPAISPTDVTLLPGQTRTLSVNNTYHSYQWYRNGSAIAGATGPSYTASQPGHYFIQVKGSASASATTSNTTLFKTLLSDQLGLNAVTTTTVLVPGITESTLYTLSPSQVAQNVSYQDGLGRTFQSIGVGQSPTGTDVVSVVAHTRNGLMDSTFLPYVSSAATGLYRPNAIRGNTSSTSYPASEQYLFYQNTPKVAQDTRPFARSLYTNDPTVRVTEQGAPGADWQPGSNHTVRQTYALNNATTYRVRYWNTNGTTTANYPDNAVTVSITTDENGNQVRTYTDARGFTVLKQVQMDETLEGISTPWLETYYIYDEYGRLQYQVPPKAMRVLGTAASLNATSSSVAELIYVYTYDARGRLVEKKVPGSVPEFYVYDTYDRPVLTQGADARFVNKWLFTKYDTYGRVVAQGLYTNSRGRASVQAWADKAYGVASAAYPPANFVERKSPGTPHGYTNLSFPKDSIEYMTVQYYDSYDFDANGTPDYSYDNTHLAGQESSALSTVRGKATGSKRALLNDWGTVVPQWQTAVVFYDRYDRPIQVRSNNFLSAAVADVQTTVYDFSGKVLKTKSTSTTNRLTWQNRVNTIAEADRLASTATASGWTTGASSQQQLAASTNGWMETVVTETNKDRAIGLSDADVSQHHNTIDYAFYLSGTFLSVYENGVSKLLVTNAMANGDVLRIERTGTTVRYYRNGTLVYTSTVPSTTLLLVDASFNSTGGTLGHTQLSSGLSASVSTNQRYTYDHAGRSTAIYQTIDNGTEQLVAAYEYNALGQLVDKKLHNTGGNTFLQSVDYRYNIRGWLQSINNGQLTIDNANDDSNDLFGMELLYNTVESGLSNTQYYNGNISAMKWKGPGVGSGVSGQRSYKYTYDKSDRLKTASFQARSASAWDAEANTLNEAMTYDHNGNIKTLMRHENQRGLSGLTVTSTATAVDDLNYSYASNLNRITKVEDAVQVATGTTGFANGVNAATEYFYSSGGSLYKDDNKGISSIVYNVLGQPRQVTFTNGKKIDYTYDASGNKLRVKTWQGTTVQSLTEYEGARVYENGVLRYFGSPEGRVVKNGSAYEYEYALADHQNNTRVVFNSVTPAPQSVTANFESAANSNFQNYTRYDFDLFDRTDAGTASTYSQRLTGATNSQVGLAKTYAVFAGDKVKIEAWAKYHNPQSTGSNLTGFAAALTNAFGVSSSSTGEALKAYNTLNDYGGLVAVGTAHNSNGYPKLFVNILLFDKNYKLLDATWQQIDGGEQPVGNGTKLPHDYMSAELTAKEAGFAYVYISHENATLVEGYFDDVVMTYTPTNVIQYNEYYPFGLTTANSWTRENTIGNNFLYNAGSELNTTTNNYEMFFRGYDPALGRMMQVDPMASKYSSISPYNYALNNPAFWNDPTGADVTWDDIFDIIDRLWNEVPMDPGGGGSNGGAGWSASGGFTGGYGYDAAVSYGTAYNAMHSSGSGGSIQATYGYSYAGQSINQSTQTVQYNYNKVITGFNFVPAINPTLQTDGPGDPSPYERFVNMMKEWAKQFSFDFDRTTLYTDGDAKAVNTFERRNKIVNTLANTEVTPYVSISYSKQMGGVIPAYGSFTYAGGNLYGTIGSDLTYSAPSLGPNFSLSIGYSIGPKSGIPGLGAGFSAGYAGMGFEMSGSKQQGLSLGQPYSMGFVLSNSPGWISMNGGYTFLIWGK
jgi:RHS repeat-associated protein